MKNETKPTNSFCKVGVRYILIMDRAYLQDSHTSVSSTPNPLHNFIKGQFMLN